MIHSELKYIEELNAFGVSEEQLKVWEKQQETPLLSLSRKDYIGLGCRVPASDSPFVALLMQKGEYGYTIPKNYVLALARTEVNLCFLTYEHCMVQMQDCYALVLPCGDFDLPERYYVDGNADSPEFSSATAKAYIDCIRFALKKEIPILAIDKGAQMVAGEMGVKIHRDTSHLRDHIIHNSSRQKAHRVHIDLRSPLYRLLKYHRCITTNSRHDTVLHPNFSQSYLAFYASSLDGVPEAWGCYSKHILCVQWHPEDMAATEPNGLMQKLFDWVADKAWDLYDEQHFEFGW